MTVIKQKHRNSTKTYAIVAYYVRTVQKKTMSRSHDVAEYSRYFMPGSRFYDDYIINKMPKNPTLLTFLGDRT